MAKLSIEVPDELLVALKLRAVREGRTMSSVVRDWMEAYADEPWNGPPVKVLGSGAEPASSAGAVSDGEATPDVVESAPVLPPPRPTPKKPEKMKRSGGLVRPEPSGKAKSGKCPMPSPGVGLKCKFCGEVHK